MSATILAGLWTGSRGIVSSEAREFRNWADGGFAYWPGVRDPNAKIFAFDFKADGSYSFGYTATATSSIGTAAVRWPQLSAADGDLARGAARRHHDGPPHQSASPWRRESNRERCSTHTFRRPGLQ
jgi:hypothetical protein